MRKIILATAMATASFYPTYAAANDDSKAGVELKQLIDDVWANTLKENPIQASAQGIDDYANDVPDYTIAGQDRRAKKAADFLSRLENVENAGLDASQKTDYGILKRQLTQTINGNKFGQRSINFTNRSGWHQNFAGMSQNLPFKKTADFQSYNNRLKQYGMIHNDAIKVANMAIKGGYTLPCDAIGGYENSINGLIVDDFKKSRFYAPYTKSPPQGMDQKEFDDLAFQAGYTIKALINPTLKSHSEWFLKEYKPNCAKKPGVSAQPNGDDYYQYRIGLMTTTDMTADEIHNIGLSEVARIRSEMVKVAKDAGYDSREAFIQHLRTDPKYYAKTPEELMEKVARVTKTIDGKMPALFGKLARLPYGIKEIPAEIAPGTTTAYYNPGSPEIGIAGNYFVNTSKLDQRPFWEIPALSVHEGVPGHHHQIALQQELPLSDFRKSYYATAFVEGWGLYSERLGIEMGLYDTPAKDMGRLSYEMWRACRLVVDTGIHSKGWGKQKAIDYMKDNTALTDGNIEAEVNRYISWPGQALAYKIGELKIRELRKLATEELGDKFSLPAFHDTVLGQGAVPLDVLEQQVKDWIKSQKM